MDEHNKNIFSPKIRPIFFQTLCPLLFDHFVGLALKGKFKVIHLRLFSSFFDLHVSRVLLRLLQLFLKKKPFIPVLRKAVIEKFAKGTEKHLQWSPSFNKIVDIGLQNRTPL